MGSVALLQSLKESILGQASVKTIYGEPISAHGKTIIPVAKIMYGYGAGAGTGGVGDTSARGEGGGGGGGVRAVPVGVIEVSEQQTRFVPITDRKKTDWGCAGGDWIWDVGGVAQTTPTLICGAVVDNGARRTCGAKAETHFNALSGTTEAVPFRIPFWRASLAGQPEGGSADGRCSSSGFVMCAYPPRQCSVAKRTN
jgi:Sporulation protein YtfJ (Spore_YtfJ)